MRAHLARVRVATPRDRAALDPPAAPAPVASAGPVPVAVPVVLLGVVPVAVPGARADNAVLLAVAAGVVAATRTSSSRST